MNLDQELKLKEQLEQLHSFPDLYYFKFIIPSSEEKLKEVLSHFSENAEVKSRTSKNGKYTSISIKEVMMSAQKVVDRYRELNNIEGLMSL